MAENRSSSDLPDTHAAGPNNTSTSDPTSNTTSRAHSIEGRPTSGRGRVKFSIISLNNDDDEEETNVTEPHQHRKPLPTLRYPPRIAVD